MSKVKGFQGGGETLSFPRSLTNSLPIGRRSPAKKTTFSYSLSKPKHYIQDSENRVDRWNSGTFMSRKGLQNDRTADTSPQEYGQK